ncbi:MAG: hypothetical protein J6T39_02700 [Clostridia bacterium]|nr:hypothetical protein [Clostridia bacterium]
MKNKSYIIVQIIGIVLGVIGLIMLSVSIMMNVPRMGESGWFEARSIKDGLMFAGVSITILGFCVGSIIAAVVKTKFSGHHKMTISKQREIMDTLRTELKDNNANESGETFHTEHKTKTCEYCGCELKLEQTACPYCGAKTKGKR